MGYILRINSLGDSEGNFSLVARRMHDSESEQFGMYPVGVFRLNQNLTALPVSQVTVNSEVFARVYFRETLRLRSFVKIKPSRNGQITLSFTDEGKPGPSRECMSFNAILENKILAKISEFIVWFIETKSQTIRRTLRSSQYPDKSKFNKDKTLI